MIDSSATFWDKTFPVIVGGLVSGLITLIVSYVLQNRLFNEQNEARKMDRWLTAYSELLSDITDNVSCRPVPRYMEHHIIKVVHYGSPKLKAQLEPWIGGRGLYKDDKFMKSMEEAKKTIMDEIAEERLNYKPR